MKIIDLLNLIAKEDFDNLPKKIKYDNLEYSLLWEYNERFYICYAEDNLSEDVWGELCISSYNLNDEIEILEE